jgi:hypothetical protein
LTIRRHTRTWIAAWLSAGVVTSSGILSYLGNSYLPGRVIAGTAILIAMATTNKNPLASAAIAGTTMGRVALVNPPGVLLAGTLGLVLAFHTYKTNRDVPFGKQLALATATTIGAFAAFLAIGRLIFPEMNWSGRTSMASRSPCGTFPHPPWSGCWTSHYSFPRPFGSSPSITGQRQKPTSPSTKQ